MIEAKQKQGLATFDVPNVFFQTLIPKQKGQYNNEDKGFIGRYPT